MSTIKEIIYLVSDELKLVSDDSIINTQHIAYVVDKYRAYILKQYYNNIKRKVASANYQTICVDLKHDDGSICSCDSLVSVQKIPDMIDVGSVTFLSNGTVNRNISYVSPERFSFAGSGKYNNSTIYATINDSYLYLKSNNAAFSNMEKVTLRGVFEDAVEAAELSCDRKKECSPLEVWEPWDEEFPLEAALIPTVVELTLKELIGAVYRPADEDNNANDDLSDIRNFLTRNMKNNFQKQIDAV